MQRTLELLESTVSCRTRWHFLVLTEEDDRAVGECSDSGDAHALAQWLEGIAPRLAGRDLEAQRNEVLGALREEISPTSTPARLIAATALGGLEQLLLDAVSRRAGEPLWKWLNSARPEPIPVYANINRMPGGRSPDDFARMAGDAVAAGFTAVKCGPFDVPQPGRPLAEVGLERIRAVRQAVGDDVTVQVDCHERLPLAQVHDLVPQLEKLGIAWLEDAVSIEQVDELAELKAATTIPLAGGELMFDPAEAFPAAARGVIDVL